VRPRDPAESVLNWESTALDPIGATVGVVVLNLVIASGSDVHPVLQMFGRLGLGVGVGAVAALGLVFVMSRFLVTDEMEAAVALLFAVAAFAIAEGLLSEAGLFATTTLGFIAANQDFVSTSRIKGFGETLEVVIVGSLFIVLGALITLDDLADYAWESAALVAVLVLLVRPLAVFVSLIGTQIDARQRAFVAWVDPRGIVAAATAAQFTGTLTDANVRHTFLLPVVFGVIVGTGVIYASTAGIAARVLGVRRAPARGVAVVGHEPWSIAVAKKLHDLGVPVLVLIGRERADEVPDGLPTASLFDDEEELGDAVAAASVAQVLVTTRQDRAVTLLTADLVELLGRHRVLDVRDDQATSRRRVRHATAEAFAPGTTRQRIDELLDAGASVEVQAHAPVAPGILLATVSPQGVVDLHPRARATAAGTSFVGLVAPGSVGTG
jgi:hypothetical protein